MSDPVIENILQRVEARLQTISTANGYLTSVQGVYRYATGLPSVFPSISIAWGGEQVVAQNAVDGYGLEDTEVSLVILGWVADSLDPQGQALRLQHDIKKAMAVDRTFNGLALYSRYTGTEVLTADDQMHGSIATVVIGFAVRVVVDETDSASQF